MENVTIEVLIEYVKSYYDSAQFSEKWVRSMAENKDLDYLYKKAVEFCGTITDEDWERWCKNA